VRQCLTNREREILRAAQAGLTDKAIARELGISVGTVRTHWGRLRLKFDAHSRAELVAMYVGAASEEAIHEAHEETERLREEIARRKKAEEELRRVNQLLQTVMSNAPVRVFVLDRHGVVTLDAGAMPNPLGLAENETIGRLMVDVVSAYPEATDGIGRALAGEDCCFAGVVHDRFLRTWMRPLRNPEGQVTGVVGIVADLTERRELEAQRERLEQWRVSMAEVIPHAFFRLRTDSTIVAYKSGEGFHPPPGLKDLAQVRAVDYLKPHVQQELLNALREAHEGGRPVVGTFEVEWEGQTLAYDATIVPFGADEVLAFVRDAEKPGT
jgi:PAS domain S-box-containing protein